MLWVLDLDGVVWLAGSAIEGSAGAVERLRAAGESVAFVTNNSTPNLARYVRMLAGVGLEVDEQELVTSAQAAASMLVEGSTAVCVGGDGLAEALVQRKVNLVDAGSRPDSVVVGRTVALDFVELAAAARAIREGSRFIATNTDATFPTPHGLEPGAGALVAYLEVASGVKAEPAGKPAAPMADLLLARFGPPGIVVGDRPDTDGRFAQRLGVDFALVLTGVTSKADLPVEPEPALVAEDLAGVVAEKL
ncbi:MAG TPA: HAD-IIA family hydrolase [Acidimicrobiales bacterium]|nr:HAD-IIA family hydrolase [Acidimicrobiales bacterium]